MPIRGLDALIKTSNLIHTAPLASLKGTRLGIDVDTFLSHLLYPDNTHAADALVAGVGGQPADLLVSTDAHLKAFSSAGVKVLFVFGGLGAPGVDALRPEPATPDTKSLASPTAEAWTHYDADSTGEAIAAFGTLRPVKFRDTHLRLMKHLKHMAVDFIVAPYMAHAQLVYLLNTPEHLVNAVWANSDLFMFSPVDKVVSTVDAKSRNLTWTSKREVLIEFNLDPEQFLDLALLAGSDLCPTFPPAAADFQLRGVLSTLLYYGSAVTTMRAFENAPAMVAANYVERFKRARAAIKYSLIQTIQDGQVYPVSCIIPVTPLPVVPVREVPSDLALVFSAKLPEEVYWHISKGLISTSMLHALITGKIIEGEPLEGGQIREYRTFIRNLLEDPKGCLSLCLSLWKLALGNYWQSVNPAVSYYFLSDAQAIPATNDTARLVKRLNECVVSPASIEAGLKRSQHIDIALCLTLQGDPTGDEIKRRDAVCATTIWRLLYARGYFNDERQLTPWGKALRAGLAQAKALDKIQESVFLIIEFIRCMTLTSIRFGRPVIEFSGAPDFGSPDDQKAMTLVLRCMACLQLITKSEPYSGPLSREALAMNSFVKAQIRYLRHLVESIASTLLLNGQATRVRDDLLDIATSLPFQTDINAAFANFFKDYCDSFTLACEGQIRPAADKDAAQEAERLKQAKIRAMEDVEENCIIVKDTPAEVKRAFRFWDVIVTIIRHAATNNLVPAGLSKDFERADAWMALHRP